MKTLRGLVALAVAISCPPIAAMDAEPPHFVAVTAGVDHVCALTDRGEAFCWGSNEFGQLGNGSHDSIPHPTPVRVAGDVTFAMLAAGLTHTCGIARDGVAYCWGANDTAQIGDGTVLQPRSTPVRVATDVRFAMIGPGGGHTCAVTVDGVGYCWGGNWHGQLGVGNRDGDEAAPCCYRLPLPIRTELRLRSATAGGINSCAVAVDGKAYCWGSPQEGRLGTGAGDAVNKSADKTVPTAVAGDTTFGTVLPRAWHTCALSTTHVPLCWGGNMLQAGPPIPTRVATDRRFTAVTTGHFHDCGITLDGSAYCWGTNTDGELGDGTTRDTAAPQRVATDRRFISIAAGGSLFVEKPGDVKTWGFTCGLTTEGAILCWGDNRHGALGNGSTNRTLTPTPVAEP